MDTDLKQNLFAEHGANDSAGPFLSIAIPHYQHPKFLEIVLESVFEQDYGDFEIVISNDKSPDDSDAVIPPLLVRSGRRFAYYSQPKNLGYDGNVRFCLAAAQGRYVFLLGNDDCLARSDVLQRLADSFQSLGLPEVAITNFQDYSSGEVNRRIVKTQLLGSGPALAVASFRSFSFVSGLIFDRQSAREHETDKWDRSIYYQIYLGCRIIAAGGRLGGIAISAVRKDVRINENTVPNYATKWHGASWSFQERYSGLDSVAQVTIDAIIPYIPKLQQSKVTRAILYQILLIQHPFWILEYRRVANWSFAVGVARGHWSGVLAKDYPLNTGDALFLRAVFFIVTPLALLIPVGLFNRIKRDLAYVIRKRQQSRQLQTS